MSLRLALSNGTKWVCASPRFHWGCKQIQHPKSCVLFGILDDYQGPKTQQYKQKFTEITAKNNENLRTAGAPTQIQTRYFPNRSQMITGVSHSRQSKQNSALTGITSGHYPITNVPILSTLLMYSGYIHALSPCLSNIMYYKCVRMFVPWIPLGHHTGSPTS
jgi:hypothetical protein